MHSLKLRLMVVGAMMLTLGVTDRALAFHDGGVAYCEGCHTMHNSLKGAVMNLNKPLLTGVQYLLQGTDQSSTCLKCHSSANPNSSYRIMTYPVPAAGTAPISLTPGGDFAYLGKTYSWLGSGNSVSSSPGERHGHNIVAADQGLVADATLTAAPGGTYPAGSLSCISCHDPHGKFRIMSDGSIDSNSTIGTLSAPIIASGSYPKLAGAELPPAGEAYGVYRLLGGDGYQPKSAPGGYAFGTKPPTALAPSTYNRTEAVTDTRVAYGEGMSEWCGNCHGAIHNDSLAAKFVHPASNLAKLTAEVTANYNAYVKTGDLTGTSANSYTSMVPYEEGTGDFVVLTPHAVNTGTVTTGPSTGNENVMCLSCHRAHATAWDSMTRWQNRSEFLTLEHDYPGTDAPSLEGQAGKYATGKTMAEQKKTFYDRAPTAYASFQRSLCNKCHAKD